MWAPNRAHRSIRVKEKRVKKLCPPVTILYATEIPIFWQISSFGRCYNVIIEIITDVIPLSCVRALTRAVRIHCPVLSFVAS